MKWEQKKKKNEKGAQMEKCTREQGIIRYIHFVNAYMFGVRIECLIAITRQTTISGIFFGEVPE